VTYNILIDGLCKKGEIKKSKGVAVRNNFERVQTDIVTYNTFIDGSCKKGEN
jgi:PPR repeat